MIQDVSYPDWLRLMQSRWQQGEHIVIIGETGSGKTGLAKDLLLIREWVVAIAIKKNDDTLEKFRQNYRIIKRWPPDYSQQRVVFWTKPENLRSLHNQREQILAVMEQIYIAGGWCVYFDDLPYLINQLKIKEPIVTFMSTGRSSGLSIVSSVQRPVLGIREPVNQCSYRIIFPYVDDREIETIGKVTGISHKNMIHLMQQCEPHDFLMFDRVRRDILIVRYTGANR